MGRFVCSDVVTSTGQGLLGNNMFAYCANNPVSHADNSGHAVETVFDFLSLGASIAEVAEDPSDEWAWAGLLGDLVDVLLPFFAGAGEAIRIARAAAEVVDTVDDLHDSAKVVDKVSDSQELLNDIMKDSACFVAGTLVYTADGNKPIEQIQENDLVWAWDESTGDVSLKRVVETYVKESSELIHVYVNGEEIVCTPTHPFYSPVKGWTDAVHLRAGDILALVNGEYVVVEKVQHEILELPVTVYNFQVEDYHTYFVSDTGVLVHNKCTNTIVSSREKALEYGRKFLGEGYTKEGPGRYVSADRFRQMRFDFTHHGGTTHHINLETFKYPIQKGTRNKIIVDEHVFW